MPQRIYKPVPEAPITAEVTWACANCKTAITRTAVTHAEKEALYGSLKSPWYCDDCSAWKINYE